MEPTGSALLAKQRLVSVQNSIAAQLQAMEADEQSGWALAMQTGLYSESSQSSSTSSRPAPKPAGPDSGVNLAEGVLAKAMEEVASKPIAPEGRMYGVVKSYNPDKGFGFIACAETYQIYKRDVFLLAKEFLREAGRCQVGSTVSFTVEHNKDGHPQARNLEVVTAEAGFFAHLSPEMEAFAFQAQLACQQILAAQIKEANQAKRVPAAFRNTQVRVDGAAGSGSIGPASAEAVARGRALSGRLPMAGASQQAVPGMEAPPSHSTAADLQAATAVMMGAASSQADETSGMNALAEFCEGGKYAQYAAALQLQYAALAQGAEQQGSATTENWIAPERHTSEPGEYLGHDPNRRFSGTVSAWNDKAAYGFITCKEARKIYAKDIFLHRSEIGREADIYKNKRLSGPRDGDKVEFNVEIIGGKPRARDVDIIPTEDPVPQPSAADLDPKRRRLIDQF